MKYIFLGSARCFHTEDWYGCAKELVKNDSELSIAFVSDQFNGEGHKTFIESSDECYSLVKVDYLLPRKISSWSNKWRNLLKLLLLPIQVLMLKRIIRDIKDDDVIIHAHSTYYAFLASFVGIPYISTPQGSEVLVRLKSKFYSLMASRAHKKASFVTVDSKSMAIEMERNIGISPVVVQNGIQVRKLLENNQEQKVKLLSMRGVAPNYRILDFLKECRKEAVRDVFVCAPFIEVDYFESVRSLFNDSVKYLGKLDREGYHNILKSTRYVISIPISDSSPRSVYEAIFCGAVAICSPNSYLNELPESIRMRIVVVDINKNNWLSDALVRAEIIHQSSFEPCALALKTYDQQESMNRIFNMAKGYLNV